MVGEMQRQKTTMGEFEAPKYGVSYYVHYGPLKRLYLNCEVKSI